MGRIGRVSAIEGQISICHRGRIERDFDSEFSNVVSVNCSCLKKMQNILGLITNHWLAKLMSLLLAVTLWAVIRSSVKETNSPSRIQFDSTKSSADSKFDLSTSIHGDRKK